MGKEMTEVLNALANLKQYASDGFGAVGAQLDRMEQQLTEMQATLSQLDARISQTEQKVHQIRKEQKEQREDIDFVINRALRSLKSSVTY